MNETESPRRCDEVVVSATMDEVVMNSGEGGQDPADSAALGDRRPLRDVSGYLAALIFTIKLKFKRDPAELTRVADVTYSVDEYRIRMQTHPEDYDDLGIVVSERGLAWLYVLFIAFGSAISMSVILEWVTGGHWISYQIPAYTLGVVGLTAAFVGCPLVIRLMVAWYLVVWTFSRDERVPDLMRDSEKSWNSFGGRGRNFLVRWICTPSNLDFVIGFGAAILVVVNY